MRSFVVRLTTLALLVGLAAPAVADDAPAAKPTPTKPAAKPAAKVTAKPAVKVAAKPEPKKTAAQKAADKAEADKAIADAAAAEAAEAERVAAEATAAAEAAAAAQAAAAAEAVKAAEAAARAGPLSLPVDGTRRLVAVLDLKGGEGAAPQASALTTMLTAEVSGQDGLRAVSRNEIQALLSQQSTAQLVGCDEPRCMADIAQLVNADLVVSGSVERLEGATVVGLTLMNTGNPETGPAIVSRQKVAWRGRDDELLLVIRPLVQRLFDPASAHTHVGNLELFAPDGATVVLDDKELGQMPLASIHDLPTGVHRLHLLKDGYSDASTDVVVARNETTITRIDMEEIPLLDQPWFWAAAGGVVLVAGGTAAGITTYALVNATPAPSRVVLGSKP